MIGKQEFPGDVEYLSLHVNFNCKISYRW